MARRTTTLLATAITLAAASPALADWEQEHGSGSEYFLSLSVLSGDEIAVGGFELDQSGRFPAPKPLLLFSEDGGQSLQPITGDLEQQGGGLFGGAVQVDSAAFVDDQTGWAAMSDKVFATADRGASWSSAATLDAPVADLHFFDASTGVAVGEEGLIARTTDGGATWTTVDSGTTADLGCMFWLDGQRGFAAGATIEETEEGFGDETTETYGDGIVLSTTDGGQTWTAGHQTSGLVLCPLFFLPDGQTGWVAGHEKGENEGQTVAHLLASTDGGATFQDTNLPTEVGTLKGVFEMPIQTAAFQAMHWTDADHGHLGGVAYVTKVNDSQSNSNAPIYRVVDYRTEDGGATWEKTDLGEIEVSLFGGPKPQDDGYTMAGHMRSLNDGFMVGANAGVWRYRQACTAETDCGPGEACAESGFCGPDPSAGPGPGPGPDSDVWAGGDAAGWDGYAGDGGTGPGPGPGSGSGTGGDGGGCAGGPGAPILPAALALLALVVLRRRRA
ncbi:MAG: WD40/YVTN/BNR-like repeat-containing protein [Myxococcota bacterium]